MDIFKQTYFNIIKEDNDKAALESWFNRPWSLKNELTLILPVILKKINLAFSNMCATNVPGKIKSLIDLSKVKNVMQNSKEIDLGSQTPGIEITIPLDTNYLFNDVYPALLQSKMFAPNNSKYSSITSAIDLSKNPMCDLLITLNANDSSQDFTKSEKIKVEKLSIKNWQRTTFIIL